jgi:hypothetical protein
MNTSAIHNTVSELKLGLDFLSFPNRSWRCTCACFFRSSSSIRSSALQSARHQLDLSHCCLNRCAVAWIHRAIDSPCWIGLHCHQPCWTSRLRRRCLRMVLSPIELGCIAAAFAWVGVDFDCIGVCRRRQTFCAAAAVPIGSGRTLSI